MSWDVILMRFPRDARSPEELPPDFAPEPLARSADVIARIKARIPNVDFSDPTWGVLANLRACGRRRQTAPLRQGPRLLDVPKSRDATTNRFRRRVELRDSV